MKIWSIIIAASVMLGSVVSAAEKIDLMKPEAWDAATQKRVSFAENSIISNLPFFMMRGTLLPVDLKKEYTVSFQVKAEGGTPVMQFGFRCFTADNKIIESSHVLEQKGTFTTLTEKAAKGSKILKVKDASKWKPFSFLALAFNAKEDFSDLPNFDIAICIPEKIEKTGNFWTVTLKQPLPKDLAANSGIRQHIRSSSLIPMTPKVKTGSGFITLKGTIKGVSKGEYTPVAWPAGTAKVSFFVQTNQTGLKNVKTILKDFHITVK